MQLDFIQSDLRTQIKDWNYALIFPMGYICQLPVQMSYTYSVHV